MVFPQISQAFHFSLLASLIMATAGQAREIPEGASGYKSDVMPFFTSHCISCHGPTHSKGEITLHSLDGDLSAGHELERWELVLEKLARGEMPPEDEPQPSDAARQAIVQWIEAGLRAYVSQASQVATSPSTRRLTNFEYQNTMRDLLGFELDLVKNLPEDPVKPYHFNNTAEFMLIGPEQMDRYTENARRAMASAIVDPGAPEVHRTERTVQLRGKGTSPEQGQLRDELGVGDETSVSLTSWPRHGDYRIRVKAAAILPKGVDEVPLRLVMGTTLRHDAGSGVFAPSETINIRNPVDHMQVFEFRGRIENHPVEPGKVTAKGQQPPSLIITAQNLYDNGRLMDSPKGFFDRAWKLAGPRVVIESIEFEAPITDVWPPPHHAQILLASPLRESDPQTYIREVLERFMTRAFRRPVTADELARFVKIYGIFAAEFATLEEALRETLAMVLVAPQFLYHTVAEDGVAVRQYELASRLSYFLWGSMPDAELMRLAAEGRLDDPTAIEAEVRRLLADARARNFVENFATQWLSIAKMKAVKINSDLFPRFLYVYIFGERRGLEVSFRPTIRDYLHAETVGFVAELIRRNASVLDIVDSDFAVLNEPLAAHYGVAGVQGIELRPVEIKPEHRLGGLLTQGSVLVGNSTGSAPHPIYRAVWLREAILGDEVKPPPAEVPALVDSAGDAAEKAVTIKDLLRRHRQKESCNDCHVRLDPWGIPFERYNAIGRFQPLVPAVGVRVRGFDQARDHDLAGYAAYLKSINTVEVQAEARVPHGPDIDGMRELKDYLLQYRQDDIVKNVIRRLLTYGIGRKLSYQDRFAVEHLFEQAKMNNYQLQDIIVAICQSDTFRGVEPKDN